MENMEEKLTEELKNQEALDSMLPEEAADADSQISPEEILDPDQDDEDYDFDLISETELSSGTIRTEKKISDGRRPTLGRRQATVRERLLKRAQEQDNSQGELSGQEIPDVPETKLDIKAARVEEVENSLDDDYIRIYNARREQQLLTGVILSVNIVKGGEFVLSISDYCGYRIRIMEREMDVTISQRDGESYDVYRARVKRAYESMIGARIYYVVRYINQENKAAIGSRRIANRIRSSIASHRKKEDAYVLTEGAEVPALVMAVSRRTAFIDVFGVLVRIGMDQFSPNFISAINNYLTVGQEVTAYITKVERDENENLTELKATMRNDVKELERQKELAAKIVLNAEYLAIVTARTNKAFFLRLKDTGLEAYAFLERNVRSPRIPDVNDQVVVRIYREQVNRFSGMPIFQVNIYRVVGRER